MDREQLAKIIHNARIDRGPYSSDWDSAPRFQINAAYAMADAVLAAIDKGSQPSGERPPLDVYIEERDAWGGGKTFGVVIRRGHQSFPTSYDAEFRDEAEFYANQLRGVLGIPTNDSVEPSGGATNDASILAATSQPVGEAGDDDDDDPGGYNTHPAKPKQQGGESQPGDLYGPTQFDGSDGEPSPSYWWIGFETREQAESAAKAIREHANLKSEAERLERLVTTRERHRLERYESKTNSVIPAKGGWKISWYEADDDEPGCSGYMLSIPSGATKEQAELAAKAIRAMEAMERLDMSATPHLNHTWAVDCGKYGLVGDTLADAILALAAQLEGKAGNGEG